MTGSLKFMTKNKGKGKSKDKEQLHNQYHWCLERTEKWQRLYKCDLGFWWWPRGGGSQVCSHLLQHFLQEPSHEEHKQPNLDVYERRQVWVSYNLGGFSLLWRGQCWSGKPGLFPAELQLKCLQKTSVNDTKQMICRETNKSEKESAQSLAKGNGNHTILDHSKATNNDATVLTNKDNTDKTNLWIWKRRWNRWWALVKVLPLARQEEQEEFATFARKVLGRALQITLKQTTLKPSPSCSIRF